MPTSQEMPVPRLTAWRWRWPQLETWHIVFCAVLVLWYALAISIFDSNLYPLAFWYMWTHLLVPILAVSAGWMFHALRTRKGAGSVRNLLLRQSAILLLAVVALPLLLSAANRLPFGQRTESWQGTTKSRQEVFAVGSGRTQYDVVVGAPSLGPRMQFRVPGYFWRNNGSDTVEGSVVKGFMGVPIAVRIDTALPLVERPRGLLDPQDAKAWGRSVLELMRTGRWEEAMRLVEETNRWGAYEWRDTNPFALRQLILQRKPHGIEERQFKPSAEIMEELRNAGGNPRMALARSGYSFWKKAWVTYDWKTDVVKVQWFKDPEESAATGVD